MPTIKLMQHQLDFLKSTKTYTGLVGGYGCGKSFIGVLKTIAKMLENPNKNVAYYLPTYPLIRDIAFVKFAEILTALNIKFTLNKTDKDIITSYGTIILRSMDNPDLIVGYETVYSLIDEADVLATNKMQDVFIKVLGRNRSKPITGKNQVDFVSTPEGYKFLYDFFVTKKNDESKKLVKGKTESNPFLPADYIDNLKESYTDKQIKAYLNGDFLNLTQGQVYYNYSVSDNSTNESIKENETLHVGVDFNITKMSAVIHVKRNNILFALDEVVNAYDTNDLITILKSRYSNRIICYPDASGAQRSTSGSSDISLLKKKFTVINNKKNPSVRERVNTFNNTIKDNNEVFKYFVNKDNCPSLNQGLQNQVYKNGVPDKEGGYDHILDSAGYCVFQLMTKKTFKISA